MKDPAKYSAASKRRWSKVSAKRRSEMMRALVVRRWKNATAEEKRENAARMVEARARRVDIGI